MKLTDRIPKQLQHPAVVIGVLVLIAFLIAGPQRDDLRKSLIKTGLGAVLIAALFALVFSVTGVPLWLIAGGAFVASGAAGDVADALTGGGSGGSNAGDSIYEQAAQACATHGGLAGGASILTSPYRRCLCKDGTFQTF